VAVGSWAPDLAHYAGRYASEECDGHVELRVEDGALRAELFGATRQLHAGTEGELVTDEGIALRVDPQALPDSFIFASWGLRGLAYRRAPPTR
jgi:hypothetical protein